MLGVSWMPLPTRSQRYCDPASLVFLRIVLFSIQKANEIAKEFDVSGYPTLFVFRKGQKFEYNGGRDERTIVSYMVGQVQAFLDFFLFWRQGF